MDTPKFYFINTFHHLYNRGVNKNIIFFEDHDYLYFLKKIKKYKETYYINIISHCIMPNHFHLFVKQTTNKFTIGKFIGDLTNAFTKGINKKYDRAGVLFEGKTKSKLVTDEKYFKWLCKYILNNPVRAGLVSNPEDWKYSSAKKYFGLTDDDLTDTEEIKNRFNSINDLISFIKAEEKKFDYSIFF